MEHVEDWKKWCLAIRRKPDSIQHYNMEVASRLMRRGAYVDHEGSPARMWVTCCESEIKALPPEWLEDYTLSDQQGGEKYKVQRGEDIVRSLDFSGYMFGDSCDMYIDDPERAARVSDASVEGACGSTHDEIIQDQIDALQHLLHGYPLCAEAAEVHLESVRRYHFNMGTLHQEVG